MALLNSNAYGELADVSSEQMKRQPGKFFKVFITGEPREKQKLGTLQCMLDFDKGEYIYNNKEDLCFIPLFIKRAWEKNVKTKGPKGEFEQTVAFGWNDEPKIDDQCKYFYLIAGLALDENQKVIPHPRDLPDADIKQGDKTLIYFKCNGVRFKSATDLLTDLGKKASTLTPLSDNLEFEKNIVSPRRFIVSAGIGVEQTNFGNKHVYRFTPKTGLPDAMVVQIMELAKGFKDDFEKQFNKTPQIASRQSKAANDSGTTVASKSTEVSTFETAPSEAKEQAQASPPPVSKEFDLGI